MSGKTDAKVTSLAGKASKEANQKNLSDYAESK